MKNSSSRNRPFTKQKNLCFSLICILSLFHLQNVVAALESEQRLDLGTFHTCAITGSGTLKCWGFDQDGELGDGVIEPSRGTPASVLELSNGVTAISAGFFHSCALTTSEGIKCWGDDHFGQLGDGVIGPNRATPTDVVGLSSGVVALSSGGQHTCALTTSNGVKCWGDDQFGALGDGSKGGSRAIPADVLGLTSDVIKVAAGGMHTCALTSSGGVKCWGRNWYGELGDGGGSIGSSRATPADVVGLTSNVVDIAAGDSHTCALTFLGGVKCWGGDYYGQLGDGTIGPDRGTPSDVLGLTSGVKAISAGGASTCAITSSDGVMCWGSDTDGKLGDGVIGPDRATPQYVTGITGGAIAISVGGSHACALMWSGRIKCWGNNDAGQLGDGTTRGPRMPKPVGVIGFPEILQPDEPGSRDLLGDFDPLLPTIVLTHGLQPAKGCDADCGLCRVNQCIDDLWTGNDAGGRQASTLIENKLGQNSVNIIQFVWEDAFQVYDCLFNNLQPSAEAYIDASNLTGEAGAKLAQLLLLELGENYNKPIHFIGHSLGTAVNAHAANHFLNASAVLEAQITALDRPDDLEGKFCGERKDELAQNRFDRNFFANILKVPRPDLTIRLDNYYAGVLEGSFSGVGDVANAPNMQDPDLATLIFYNHPELIAPHELDSGVFDNEGVGSNDHSGVHQWYRWTINNENPINGGGANVCVGEFDVFSIDDSLNPCNSGWKWANNGCGISTRCRLFPPDNADPVPFGPQAALEISEAPVEFGCKVECSANNASVSCPPPPGGTALVSCSQSEPTTMLLADGTQAVSPEESISAQLTINIPLGATTLWFEYQFLNAGDGDYATLFLNEDILWVMTGSSLHQPGTWKDSGPIDISSWSGEQILTVVLYQVGPEVANFKLKNLRFSFETVVPRTPGAPNASDDTHDDRVQVSWVDVTGEDNYEVYRCDSDLISSCGTPIGTPIFTSFDDLNATVGVTYYYRVKACSNLGGCSDLSVYDIGRRKVAPPPSSVVITSFTATPNSVYSGESVTLSWSTVNATSCFATGGLGGWNALTITIPSGSANITIQTAGNYVFSLECQGLNNSAAKANVTVKVNSVTNNPDNELRNIATRAEVRFGNEITIGGFVISGNTKKCVVVQGLGPSLAVPDGVSYLADPVLTLKSGLTTIAGNNNWEFQNNPGDTQIIRNLGLPFTPKNYFESAIYKCLDPGSYTALLTNNLPFTGVGTVAVYDADDGSSYLKNISTRSWVGTQHTISIAGLVIKGNTPKQILVVGLGPSMQEKFPQLGALSNPRLRLFRGPNEIASNDDWGDAANAGVIGALAPPLPPTHPKEPAILMTLEPGLYTAHLLGVGGETGIGNVAVYDLTGRIQSDVSITSFNATPGSITVGESTTLSWTTNNATSCTPSGGTGEWNAFPIPIPSGARTITISTAGTYEFTLTCLDADGGPALKRVVVTANPIVEACSQTLFVGIVTNWKDFWSVNFPEPVYANSLATIPQTGFFALEINTGDVIDTGVISSLETTTTGGVRTGSLSKCPGDFDVAPECRYTWGSSGGITWSTDNYAGACQLEPNTTYYSNFTFTDGFDPGTSTCQAPPCITKLRHYNP